MWGVFGKPLKRAIQNSLGLHHRGRRQPMSEPEGCATVLGAVGGRFRTARAQRQLLWCLPR